MKRTAILNETVELHPYGKIKKGTEFRLWGRNYCRRGVLLPIAFLCDGLITWDKFTIRLEEKGKVEQVPAVEYWGPQPPEPPPLVPAWKHGDVDPK